MGDVGVDVERPVGRGDPINAGVRQALDQDLAVGGVARHVGI